VLPEGQVTFLFTDIEDLVLIIRLEVGDFNLAPAHT
jgi:hypothetical protein